MKTARATRERTGGTPGAAAPARPAVVPPSGFALESHTRTAVVRLLMERGPITATAVGEALGLSAAGVRRHLDALIDMGDVQATAAPARPQRGRGRPAKRYQLTQAGRAQLRHGYDDLASAALRQLREIGGESAVEEFARRRVAAILAQVPTAKAPESLEAPETPGTPEAVAERIAEALTQAGFAASTAKVGSGVEICQHHCPVAHVAAEFPQLCEAEEKAFAAVLGTHVQRLATIANGDCACTTFVPLTTRRAPAPRTGPRTTPPDPAAQPATATTRLRKEPA